MEGVMKYTFLVITQDGPQLLTQEQFEEFLSTMTANGLTEMLDEDEDMDYERMNPHQVMIMKIEYINVNPERKSWTY